MSSYITYNKFKYFPSDNELKPIGTRKAKKCRRGANLQIRWCHQENAICVYAEHADISTIVFVMAAEPVAECYLKYLKHSRSLHLKDSVRGEHLEKVIAELQDFMIQILNCALPY